jgi:hypothetical protein
MHRPISDKEGAGSSIKERAAEAGSRFGTSAGASGVQKTDACPDLLSMSWVYSTDLLSGFSVGSFGAISRTGGRALRAVCFKPPIRCMPLHPTILRRRCRAGIR